MKSQVPGGAGGGVCGVCARLGLARPRVGGGDGAVGVALRYCMSINITHDVKGVLIIWCVWEGGGEREQGGGGEDEEK
jgi:hypothetical protein